ncbi:hypothetical protein C4K08_3224 [Pseudomonas chlororaphis subsp. aureofaciens]|nr:hypothetical protein C4K08_3224 [Pseudomonas chlororaphis subsp. aureofaciens]
MIEAWLRICRPLSLSLKKINYNLLFYMIFVGLEEVLFFFCRGFIFLIAIFYVCFFKVILGNEAQIQNFLP